MGSQLRAVFYTLYHMGMAAQGRVRSMLVFTVLAVAIGVTYLILSRSFLALAAGSRGAAQIAYKALRLLVSQAAHLPLPLLLHQRYAHYHGRNGVQEKARVDKERAWQDYLRLCKAVSSRSYLETLHDANLAQTPSRPVPSSVPAATRQKFCLRRSQSRTAADALDARPAAPFDSDMIQCGRASLNERDARPFLFQSSRPDCHACAAGTAAKLRDRVGVAGGAGSSFSPAMPKASRGRSQGMFCTALVSSWVRTPR